MFDSSCQHKDDSVQPCVSYIKGGHCSRQDVFRCPEYIRMHEPVMSYSSVQDFTTCQRKFYHSFIQGLTARERSKALTLGSLAAQCFGILHDEKIPLEQDRIARYLDVVNDEIGNSLDETDSDSIGDPDLWQLKAIFSAYCDLGNASLVGETEKEFYWKIPGVPSIHGYIDLLQREKDAGNSIGWEFKYTADPDRYYDMFAMEDQVMTYLIARPDISEFHTRCFRKPQLRVKNSERISEFYQRVYEEVHRRNDTHFFVNHTYYRKEYDLDGYVDKISCIVSDVMQKLEASRPIIDKMYFFYQNKRACHTPFECEFVPICTNKVISWDQYKKREVKHGTVETTG